MDLAAIEQELIRLDALYRPVAMAPVDLSDRGAVAGLGARVAAGLPELGVDDQTQALLHVVINVYEAGDETARTAIRSLFDRCTSFRWAAQLPQTWQTGEEFRARLIHLSARDQATDTRDEILALQHLCATAERIGIDTGPILDEVASMSSTVDRYGMGSMRAVILQYGIRRTR